MKKEKTKVLLLECDDVVARLVENLLKLSPNVHFETSRLTELSKALEWFDSSSNKPDIILLSPDFPDVRGSLVFELVYQKAFNIPIIILSNNKNEDLAIETVQRGAQDYIRKSEMDSHSLTTMITYSVERIQIMNELHKRVEQLQESEERLKVIIEEDADGIVIVKSNGVVSLVNRAAEELFGRTKSEIESSEFGFPISSGDTTEIQVLNKNKEPLTAEMRTVQIEWEFEPSYLVSIRDVTVRKKSESRLRSITSELRQTNLKLKHLTFTDSLTELLNRRGFEKALYRELEIAKREGFGIFILFFDLDNFKQINDNCSHSFGDFVLQRVAECIKHSVRANDYACRLGGDEFIILFTNARQQEARNIAERIRLQISNLILEHKESRVTVTLSAGLIEVTQNLHTLDEIIAQGDILLYRSKAQGKNQVSTHASEAFNLKEDEEQRLRGLKTGSSIYSMKQSVVDLASNRIVGFEFLTRSEIKGLELPDLLFQYCLEKKILSLVDYQCFIKNFESSQKISSDMKCYFNLFPETILDLSVGKLMEDFSKEGNLNRCAFEISNQQIVGDASNLVDKVKELKKEGVEIAIDNVGFGRSCLESLIILQPNIIKLDRRCITGVATNSSQQRILKKLFNVLKHLGANIIAGGIEKEEERDVLLNLGVEFGQGYFFQKPSRA